MPLVTSTKACVPCRMRKTRCDAATNGVPCSGCVSRKCEDQCVVSARKRRRRAGEPGSIRNTAALAATPAPRPLRSTHTPGARQNRTSLAWSYNADSATRHPATPDSIDKRQPQTQLHYFHILKDAVHDDATHSGHNTQNGTPSDAREDELLSPSGQAGYNPPDLDDLDKEYLHRKGVFNLPDKDCLVILLKTYFEMMDAFSPIIDKTDFIIRYQSGNCSLFLLYAILAVSASYAPQETISACGFTARSDAQTTFATRATLLYDFQFDNELLPVLQGALLLTKIIPDKPIDKDSNYWYYTAMRLATKLEIYNHTEKTEDPNDQSGIWRRIAWMIYARHIFHITSEFRNVVHLNSIATLPILTKRDWGVESIPKEYQDIVPRTTEQQKAMFIAHCELSSIHGGILSTIADDPRADLQVQMQEIDTWRMALPSKLQLATPCPNSDFYYLELQTTSYRFEATVCRLIQRQLRSVDAPRSEWAKQRLRTAMLELDTITGRLLANGMIKKVPISGMTAIPALLALHIAAALDPAEPEIVQSMSRISISQTMLALHQLREMPPIKKAIPIFELILAKKGLYREVTIPKQVNSAQEEPETGPDTQSQDQSSDVPAPDNLDGSYDSFITEFLEYDTLNKWDFGQLDFSLLG